MGTSTTGRRAGLAARHDEARQQVEPLLGAGEGQDVALGIERAGGKPIAPGQPVDDRLAQLRGAGHRRVLVPLVRVRGEGLGQQRRRLMLRLADRHQDRRVVDHRRHRVEQRAQRLERIVGQGIELRVERHARPQWRTTRANSRGTLRDCRRVAEAPPSPAARSAAGSRLPRVAALLRNDAQCLCHCERSEAISCRHWTPQSAATHPLTPWPMMPSW